LKHARSPCTLIYSDSGYRRHGGFYHHGSSGSFESWGVRHSGTHRLGDFLSSILVEWWSSRLFPSTFEESPDMALGHALSTLSTFSFVVIWPGLSGYERAMEVFGVGRALLWVL